MASDPSFFAPHGVSEDSLWFEPQQQAESGEDDSSFLDNPAAWMWRRALQYEDGKEDGAGGYAKKAKEAVRIDYSVLSVAVMTLGLIMMVELARHKLDHAAHHKPFLKAVLEGVYEELATLGIVEFLLHVMAEYYEEYDKVRFDMFIFILNACSLSLSLCSPVLEYHMTHFSMRLFLNYFFLTNI